MTASAKAICDAARLLTGPGRAAFLEEACSGDAGLRQRVEKMLSAEEEATQLTPSGVTTVIAPAPEQPGEQIGRYKLLQEIGEGGFGTVWMAEQVEPVSRRVALKIIKLGMDTREVIARFEAERQALAMMEHPNIAKVLDAGATDQGRPFFVMELVKGVPITVYCDEAGLGTRERLALFGDVCSAINHAHQKGVIHRDIKPSNVMVTLHGDKPVVKVIDFGIAKATQGKLTDKTLFTRFEQFIGTPVYMSPEQASMSGLDVDTRSDIYALGILLYELLTGKPPFDAKTLAAAGYEEMRRIIREVEPPRPSSRLSTVAGEERTLLAKARGIVPERLNRLVEPDLDWIVMKAIEKDRTRRYETANGLALDIQQYLADKPVSATPPGAGYRFRKFARRNKTALRVATGIAAVLVAATAVSTWQAVRATDAERRTALTLSRTRIALAERQWHVGNVANARKLLEACPDEHRLWDWQTMKALLADRSQTFEAGETGGGGRGLPSGSRRVILSPDGTTVAYPTGDGILLRKADGTDAGRQLKAPPGDIEGLAFSTDGSRFACVANHGFSGQVRFWNLDDPAKAIDLAGTQQGANPDAPSSGTGFSIMFANEGRELVVAGGSSLRVWDIATGRLTVRMEDDSLDLEGLAALPDGSGFIAGCRRGRSPDELKELMESVQRNRKAPPRTARIVVLSRDPAKVAREIPLETDYIRTIAFSPDGRLAALPGKKRGDIEIWNLADGKVEAALQGHQQALDALAFSSDGRRLVSAGRDKTVKVWDLQKQAAMHSLTGHLGEISDVSYRAADGVIASISGRGEVKLWRPFEAGTPDAEPDKHYEEISQDGSRIARLTIEPESGSGRISLRPAGAPENSGVTLDIPSKSLPGRMAGFAFSPDGKTAAVGLINLSPESGEEASSRIVVFSAETGAPLQSLRADLSDLPEFQEDGMVRELAKAWTYGAPSFSPDSTRLAASFLVFAVVWEVSSGKTLMRGKLSDKAEPTAFAWHPDPSVPELACGSGKGHLHIFDVETGNVLRDFGPRTSRIHEVAFSPDGKLLASAAGDGHVRLWSRSGATLVHDLAGHAADVLNVRFSRPHGLRLLTRSADGTARFWDTQSGEEIVSLPLKELRGRILNQARNAAADIEARLK